MEQLIFKKMRLKVGSVLRAIHAPEQFVALLAQQSEFPTVETGNADVYCLFVTSQAEYFAYIEIILPLITEKSVIWIGYKKAKKASEYDINRDRLVELAANNQLKACGMVALSPEWALLRVKLNPTN